VVFKDWDMPDNTTRNKEKNGAILFLWLDFVATNLATKSKKMHHEIKFR